MRVLICLALIASAILLSRHSLVPTREEDPTLYAGLPPGETIKEVGWVSACPEGGSQ